MRRREFIVLLGGAVVAWSLPLRAQQAATLPTIGFLGASIPSTQKDRVAAFLQRLRELGWIEGRTVAIEYRWAEGRSEGLTELAAELVRLRVTVIVTGGAPAVFAAEQASSTIPIVFAVVSDPVGSHVVTTLARPGGNATGLSYQGPDLATKRLELIREVVPNLRRLAVMANPEAIGAVLELREVQAAAGKVGVEIAALELRRAEEIAPALAALKHQAQALYVCADPFVNSNRLGIIAAELDARLPTIYGESENVVAGGLLSYGPNIRDLYRRAAELVDKILRGAKPADIPVEQPTKFELVINLKTAKGLGLDIPATMLARADEVIE